MGEFEKMKGDQCPCNVENWESTGEEEERQDLTGHLKPRGSGEPLKSHKRSGDVIRFGCCTENRPEEITEDLGIELESLSL